jgi:hypothetical protein
VSADLIIVEEGAFWVAMYFSLHQPLFLDYLLLVSDPQKIGSIWIHHQSLTEYELLLSYSQGVF